MPRDVVMPVLGMTQDTGVLVRWLQRPGERVTAGTPLMEVETDKAVVEVDAPADGTLGDVTLAEGEEAAVGTVIARIYLDGEPRAGSARAGAVPDAARTGAAPDGARSDTAPAVAPPPARGRRAGGAAPPAGGESLLVGGAAARVLASPKARRLARERGVDLTRLTGSGPGGAVLAADVPAADVPGGDVPGGYVGPDGGARLAAAPVQPAAASGERPAAVLECSADIGVLLHGLARAGPGITTPDVVVLMVAVALSDHRCFGGGTRLELVIHTQDAARAGWARAGSLTSAATVAALRRRATTGDGVEATTAADTAGDPLLLVHDLTSYPLRRTPGRWRPVTLVLGAPQELPAVRAGAVVVHHSIPLTLAFDPTRLAEPDAVSLLLDVQAMIDDPSLVVLRLRG